MSDSEQEYDPSTLSESPKDLLEPIIEDTLEKSEDVDYNQESGSENPDTKADEESDYNPDSPTAPESPNAEAEVLEGEPKQEAEQEEEQEQEPEQVAEHEPEQDAETKPDTEQESQPEPQNETEQKPEPQTENDNTNTNEEDDYDPEAEVDVSKETSPVEEPESQSQNNSSNPVSEQPLSKSEQIQRFNSIISHFMMTDLPNDPTFQSLLPDQKSLVVLAEYNKAKGTNIQTPINFQATTSFNRKYMKKYETAFPLVPVNPFCKRPDLDAPKSAEFQLDYNKFINDETQWLRTGRVETLPSGSRLFIGNLPVNTISKEDCYRIFRPYGEIVQISIKPGYGFVQFATSEGCNDALEGETNVPLHGKMLQLEVSKTQIRQAKEYQERQRRAAAGGSAYDEADTGYSRRARSRSPSPRRDPYRRRSPPPTRAHVARDYENGADCHVFQLPHASSILVRSILKVIRKHGLSFKMEQDNHDIENAGNDAAYAGAMAVIVVGDSDLNVKTFEKTADGGIKFDEYTNLSADDADSILSGALSKRGGVPSSQGSSSSGYDQNSYYNRNNNRGNSMRGRGNMRGRGHMGPGLPRMGSRGGYDNYRGGNEGHNYGQSPPNGGNQYGGGYQGYQQAPPVPLQPPMAPQQQGAPPVDPASIYAQLQNYDPNTVQQVLALLGNQQQPRQQQSPPMSQQQYGGYPQQQQYGGYPQQAPPPQQPPQPPYGGYQGAPPPQQAPQQPPYGQYPPPQQAPAPAPAAPAISQQSPSAQHAQPGSTSSGSSLLEALARLKKNS